MDIDIDIDIDVDVDLDICMKVVGIGEDPWYVCIDIGIDILVNMYTFSPQPSSQLASSFFVLYFTCFAPTPHLSLALTYNLNPNLNPKPTP